MNKRNSLRNRLWIVLILIVCMVTGCAGNVENAGSGNVNNGEEAADILMGRYMETEFNTTDMLTRPACIVKRTDGSFVIFDYNTGMHQSTDEGKTWEAVTQSWFDEEKEQENYILNIAVSATGGLGYITSVSTESESDEEDFDLNLSYYYVDEEGNKIELDLSYSKDSYDYVNVLYFAPDGKLYGAALGGKVYEINTEDGSVKVIYEGSETIKDMAFTGDRMLLVSSRDILIYNRKSEELEEKDAFLNEFAEKEMSKDKYSSDQKSFLIIGGAEENVIYMAFEKGLYKHVLGGSEMEQLIDGSLCTLGEPSAGLVGMNELSDNRYLILFYGKLILYTYDKTITAVPSKHISAYSLTKNELLQQAISNYQKKNPDVYVKYEIGMEESSGITREDALKKLNTEIMAGKGPDFLLMDGLPINSFIEKGMLADISPYIAEMETNGILLQNILDVYKKDGGMYTLPVEISTMLIAGDKNILNGITDLKTLADASEELRVNNPSGSLFGCYTEEMILRILAMNAMPAIVQEDGRIDTEKLTEFLTQAKRIYEAEAAGITEERRQNYKKIMEEADENLLSYIMSTDNKSFSMLTKETKLAIGSINNFDWELGSLVSLKERIENYGIAAYHGMKENVFVPRTLAAISSKSENQELSGELLQVLFSEETLNLNMQRSFAINKNTLKNEMSKINGYGGEVYGAMASSDEDGNYVTLDIRGATNEEMNEILTLLEQANIPNCGYEVIENALYEIGQNALNGTMSIEETGSEINKKVAIYLAE